MLCGVSDAALLPVRTHSVSDDQLSANQSAQKLMAAQAEFATSFIKGSPSSVRTKRSGCDCATTPMAASIRSSDELMQVQPRRIEQFPGSNARPPSRHRPHPAARQRTAPGCAGKPWRSQPASYQGWQRQSRPWTLLQYSTVSPCCALTRTLFREARLVQACALRLMLAPVPGHRLCAFDLTSSRTAAFADLRSSLAPALIQCRCRRQLLPVLPILLIHCSQGGPPFARLLGDRGG
jgi:hypothetical protein